jgi:hypothetical protein
MVDFQASERLKEIVGQLLIVVPRRWPAGRPVTAARNTNDMAAVLEVRCKFIEDVSAVARTGE